MENLIEAFKEMCWWLFIGDSTFIKCMIVAVIIMAILVVLIFCIAKVSSGGGSGGGGSSGDLIQVEQFRLMNQIKNDMDFYRMNDLR